MTHPAAFDGPEREQVPSGWSMEIRGREQAALVADGAGRSPAAVGPAWWPGLLEQEHEEPVYRGALVFAV